jgi:hypothetical protein
LKGKEADKPVYRVDSGLVQLYNLLLAISKRVAVEMGQWTGKRRLLDDENIVRPDLNKLTEEENRIFERLFNKAAPRAPKGSIQ